MTPGVRASGKDDEGKPPTGRDLSAPDYSRSLVRGLAVLACFTPERPVRGVVDVADEMGISPPSAHRYLSTLVALGYLQRDRKHQYRLTLRVTRLGLSTLASATLRDHAHRYVEELSKHSSFTVSLAVLDGSEILCLDRVQSIRHQSRQAT